jgi:teichoic acid transport system ATP-binding protein
LDEESIPWKKGENVFYLEYEKMALLGGEYYFDVEDILSLFPRN